MIEFNYDKIMKPKTTVHCDTQEKAYNLLEWADSVGLKWGTGVSYFRHSGWYMNNGETCYDLYNGALSRCKYYKKYNYTILKYEDVLMEENKSIKDGWYYIKLNQSKEIEKILPPTRCVYVKDNKAKIHKSLSYVIFDVTEEMIESPAYVIGKEYEFSNDKKEWVKDIYIFYIGYDTDSGYLHQSRNNVWDYIREIKEPDIEINVKINGKEVKLSEISEETLLKIRQRS